MAQAADHGRTSVCFCRWCLSETKLGRRGSECVRAGGRRRQRGRVSGDSWCRGRQSRRQGILEQFPAISEGARTQRSEADRFGQMPGIV